MKTRWIFWLALALWLPAAQAGSKIWLERNIAARSSTGPSYNPFSPEEYFQEITLEVRHEGDPARYALALPQAPSGEGELRRGEESLKFRWARSDGRALNLPVGGQAVLYRGSFSANQTVQSQSFQIQVLPNQVVSPGIYSTQVPISLLDETTGLGQSAGTQTIRLAVQVQEVIEVSLASSGSSNFSASAGHALQLGNLEEGKQARCAMNVRSNTPYRFSIASEGGGFLLHRSAKSQARLPYTLDWAGRRLPLAQGIPQSLPGKTPGRTATGDSFPIEVTVGKVDGLPAGEYQDVLIFTITSEN